MKVNIYYGGRGLMDDPTLYVLKKIQQVLEELNVTVERFNLAELKNNILTLPQTLKQADGIILASTVEWYGIGGFMYQFLDACWLYGDKEKISQLYMCPIVMSTTYGEREGKHNLQSAWEMLGGRPCEGISGYIDDIVSFEKNENYANLIEKKAENLYRTIRQQICTFPSSNQAVKRSVSITKNTDLSPQESEQLSQYAADDVYVQTQKQDIQELTSLFRDMMGEVMEDENTEEFVKDFQDNFKPIPGIKAVYKIAFEEKRKSLIIDVNINNLKIYYGTSDKVDVEISTDKQVLNDIIFGRTTFQGSFMTGNMKMKGDFKNLRLLDQLFEFQKGEL